MSKFMMTIQIEDSTILPMDVEQVLLHWVELQMHQLTEYGQISSDVRRILEEYVHDRLTRNNNH